MKAWFLIVLFNSNPHAKIAPFPTEAECKKFMPSAIQEFKDNKDVKSISCMPGELNEGKKSKDIEV